MKITVIGTGYVGLVSGACFADVGHDVLCLDTNETKINRLKKGEIPIYEPGLGEMVARSVANQRLDFTTNAKHGAEHGVIQLIAVGTPPDEDGSADLKYVISAAREIGRYMKESRVIVNKSTVPVGTADKVNIAISEELRHRKSQITFSVVSNPEFLKEGAAIADFMKPDRIVIGAEDQRSVQLMRELYAPFQRNHERMIIMDVKSAELTKYAANAMLAARISFMNELANLSEKIGTDIEMVRRGIGSDPRIGYHFLYPGVGYGGSCFPKDVRAMIRTAADVGENLHILKAVDEVNQKQKSVLSSKILRYLGDDLSNKTIAVWGLAFKPNTDDMRDAPSLVLIGDMISRGARIQAYDPVCKTAAEKLFAGYDQVKFSTTPVDALNDADVLAIVTEWKEFQTPNFQDIKSRLRLSAIFDGRNLYDPEILRQIGLNYFPIGRKQPQKSFPI